MKKKFDFVTTWNALTEEQRQRYIREAQDKDEYPDTEYGRQFGEWLRGLRDADLYQRQRAAANGEIPFEKARVIFALGLAGEAGEVADYLKKVIGHGREFDRDKLVDELGDVLWYVSQLAHIHGITMSEIMFANRKKLTGRYPDGFKPGHQEDTAHITDVPMDASYNGIVKLVKCVDCEATSHFAFDGRPSTRDNIDTLLKCSLEENGWGYDEGRPRCPQCLYIAGYIKHQGTTFPNSAEDSST